MIVLTGVHPVLFGSSGTVVSISMLSCTTVNLVPPLGMTRPEGRVMEVKPTVRFSMVTLRRVTVGLLMDDMMMDLDVVRLGADWAGS